MADTAGTADALLVATLNLRNIADRWTERLPLLLADMAALQPDLIGVQECVFAVQQDRILGAAGEGTYAARRGWAGRPEYGNAILGKSPLELGAGERLDLGRNRSALRVPVTLTSGQSLHFVVTHLHHLPPDEAIREEQAIQLTEWLRPDAHALVVVGDFNAEPDSDEIRYLRGYHSRLGRSVYFADCFAAAGDGSPGYTYARENPFALRAHEPNRRLDYIFARGPDRALRGEPLSARRCFTVAENGVFPSDHYGVFAEIQAAPRKLDPL